MTLRLIAIKRESDQTTEQDKAPQTYVNTFAGLRPS